jgi:hypothetical protein
MAPAAPSMNAAGATADAAPPTAAKAAPGRTLAEPVAVPPLESPPLNGNRAGNSTSAATGDSAAAPGGAAATARARSAESRGVAAPDAATLPRPDAWMQRILALRTAHDDEAADRELAAFERAYPGARIPEQARRSR